MTCPPSWRPTASQPSPSERARGRRLGGRSVRARGGGGARRRGAGRRVTNEGDETFMKGRRLRRRPRVSPSLSRSVPEAAAGAVRKLTSMERTAALRRCPHPPPPRPVHVLTAAPGTNRREPEYRLRVECSCWHDRDTRRFANEFVEWRSVNAMPTASPSPPPSAPSPRRRRRRRPGTNRREVAGASRGGESGAGRGMGDGDAMGGGGAGAGAGPEGTGLETVRGAPSRGRCPLPGAPAAPPEPRPPRRARTRRGRCGRWNPGIHLPPWVSTHT